MTIVGMDVHKKDSTVALLFDDNHFEIRRFATVPERFSSLHEEFPHAVFVMEACGVHEWIHDHLQSRDANVNVVPAPKRENKQKKSDPEDAKRLARRWRAGELQPIVVAPRHIRDMRDDRMNRKMLVHARVRLINRIKSIATNTGVHAKLNSNHIRRKKSEFIEHLPQTAILYTEIEHLDKLIKQEDKKIENIVNASPEMQRICTVPGMGNITSFGFYIKTWDINRFNSADELVSYLGSDPVWESSGEQRIDKHHTSKSCENSFRSDLNQAILSHIRCAPESSITQDYHRTSQRTGKARARGRARRQLIKTIYHMLKEQRDFTMQRPARFASCRTQAPTRLRAAP